VTAAVADLVREVEGFLYAEAELLDDGRLREWLELLADEVVYRVPVRIVKERGESGVSSSMFHLDEDRDSLELRVDRIETGFAWAEDPPSRLRHFVANVRVREDGDGTLRVRSNLLVYRARWDRPQHDLLSGERHDVLRRTPAGLRLAERVVVLDATTVPTLNLSFFL
jgi:ethylbenzene dioxygenase beta subunit